MSSRSTTFVLIHGAWHGAWCWQKLRSLLTLAGHRVLAPDLPGLGQDRTPLAAITFASYVERVIDLLDRTHEPVILVGHSLGGMTISQVAEERPEKIRWLAYLTAVLPRAGESASSILDAMGPDQALFSCIESDEKSMRLRLPESLPFFYHDCLPEDSRLAEKLLRSQALLPLAVPVALSQRFAGVPRAYLG